MQTGGTVVHAVGKHSDAPKFNTQNVVTGSRALGTNYENTSGYPMLVIVSMSSTTGDSGYIYVKSSNPADTQIARYVLTANIVSPITFIVPVGYWYRITRVGAAAAIDTWTEYT